jgi:hypothetical protein
VSHVRIHDGADDVSSGESAVCWSISRPITPYTTVLALIFVLGVTAVKDAYEDYVSADDCARVCSKGLLR